MTSLNLPRTACQAFGQDGSRCARVPCFQAQLEAAAYPKHIRRSADACAGHLGDVVQALTDWAREHHLTTGHVTVLAIDPAADVRRSADPAAAGLTSFAFTTIPLTPR